MPSGVVLFVVLSLLSVSTPLSAADSDLMGLLDSSCATCQNIVKHFKEGLAKTSKASFGGGNTHWEEKNLGTFAFSETRFLEIMENLCPESGKELKDCHHMVEAQEEVIESWWFKHYAKQLDTDLNQFLCVEHIKACCPSGTYGPTCNDCVGGRDKPCGGHGRCAGDGTRSGTGQCTCDAGFTGTTCDSCDTGYHQQGETSFECIKCHLSCESSCSGPGPLSCAECADGWVMRDGCQDEDECQDEAVCEENEFCTNTEGSYRCTKCNRACLSCKGPSNTNCTECSVRYFHNGTACVQCHESCADSCTDSTATGCSSCAEGWIRKGAECHDLDECAGESVQCAGDEYCVNTVGSHKCSTCHSSCRACRGPGNNGCTDCKDGYVRDADKRCVDVDECSLASMASESSVNTLPSCSEPHMTCINTPGSYRCDCDPGYQLMDNKCIPRPKDFRPETKKPSDSEKSKPKTSPEKKKKKEQKKSVVAQRFDAISFVAVLVTFVVAMYILKTHLLVQSLVTVIFWFYMYWFANHLERSSIKRD